MKHSSTRYKRFYRSPIPPREEMRKLTYYMASTLDGFIAHEDGSFGGFLPEGEHITDYLKSLHEFDTVVMGRKTYEVGLREGITNPYPHLKTYVVSRTLKESPDEKVELISDNIGELVRRLKQEPGQDIYLCGGAELATTLLIENLIDDVILKVNPVLFGSGIPLVTRQIKQIDLELTHSKIYPNGVLFLYYRIRQVFV